jgi:hypothetical protein
MISYMKIYIGYDKESGKSEGSILIFANSIKEAKRTGAPVIMSWTLGEYINVRVNLLKDKQFQYLHALAINDDPHVIDHIPTCDLCEMWGTGIITNGICSTCNPIGDK